MNSPGKKLTALSQVRAFMFSANIDSIETKKLTEAWDFIEDTLGEERLEQYILIVASTLFSVKPSDDILDALTRATRDAQTSVKLREHFRSFVTNYFNLEYCCLQVGANSIAINKCVKCLNALNAEFWKPAALLWLAKNHSQIETAKFFQSLEALCLGMTILSYTESKKAKRMKQVIDRIEQGDALSAISSELFLSTSERRKISDVLDKPISARAKFLKPLLLRVNVEIADQNATVEFPSELTIEHVLPQNPRSGSEWMDMFPNNSERRLLSEMLGNYALLSASPNARGGNRPFNEKKRIYFGLEANQGFPLTTSMSHYEHWTAEVILSRTEELGKRTKQILDPFTT